MLLKDKLTEDMKAALKSRKSHWLSTIRLALAAIKNREIELRRQLEEKEVLEVLASQVRIRKEAIEHFQKGRRADLVAKEEEELKYLQEYLPAPFSEGELEQEISQAIAETGAKGLKDLGRVMKWLIPRVVGRVDNRLASDKARQVLAKMGG